MTAQATAPNTATVPKTILCRAEIGERSMMATGGRCGSVRMKVTSPRVSSVSCITRDPCIQGAASVGLLTPKPPIRPHNSTLGDAAGRFPW